MRRRGYRTRSVPHIEGIIHGACYETRWLSAKLKCGNAGTVKYKIFVLIDHTKMLFLETTAIGQMFIRDGLINSVNLNCKEGENKER